MNEIVLEGAISLLTLQKLEKIMAKEYAIYSRNPENRKLFRSRAKQVNIKRINFLINSNGGINPLNKERTKNLLKYFVRMGIKKLEINSPGGHLIEIFPLGILIRELNIEVSIAENGLCASACSYLFHQANYRKMKPQSQLMYHLGIVQQGESLLDINTCHVFNMNDCHLSSEFKLTMESYKHFINSLPEIIKNDVLVGKDRFVDITEAIELELVN